MGQVTLYLQAARLGIQVISELVKLIRRLNKDKIEKHDVLEAAGKAHDKQEAKRNERQRKRNRKG